VEDKLAIILSGGGFKGCYGAGILCELAENEKYGIKEPFIVSGHSSGALTCLGYIIQAYDFLENTWTNTVAKKGITRSFISWGWKGSSSLKDVYNIFRREKWKDCIPKKNLFKFFDSSEWKNYSKQDIVNLLRPWKFIDVDYMIDEIFRKQKPLLDFNKVYSSPTKFLVSALDVKTGKMGYFSNRDQYLIEENPEGIIDICHGSAKLPIASGFSPKDIIKAFIPRSSSSIADGLRAEVKVKEGRGDERCICDSLLTSSCWTHVERVVNEGADKILIIDHDSYEGYNSPYDEEHSDRETRLFNFWFNRQSENFQKNYRICKERARDYFEIEIPKLKADGVLHTITMPKGLIGTLVNNEKRLREVFPIGREFVDTDEELFRFLKW
jgi:predicted patatin/cPLA2 family phospholipase